MIAELLWCAWWRRCPAAATAVTTADILRSGWDGRRSATGLFTILSPADASCRKQPGAEFFCRGSSVRSDDAVRGTHAAGGARQSAPWHGRFGRAQ
jgi:hypothetical protein